MTATDWLTPREMLILRMRAKGVPIKAVAADLGLSDQTVKGYLYKAYQKLGVPGVIEAMNVLGWVTVPTDAEYKAWLVERERALHRERLARIEADAAPKMGFIVPERLP